MQIETAFLLVEAAFMPITAAVMLVEAAFTLVETPCLPVEEMDHLERSTFGAKRVKFISVSQKQ